MKRFTAFFLFSAVPLLCQTNRGELRLIVTDPAGLGVNTTVQITSRVNQYRNALATSDLRDLDVQRLPFGTYELEIKQPGFAAKSESIEIRSSLPTAVKGQLQLPEVNESITVGAANTLSDPDEAGFVSQVGAGFIQDRLSSRPRPSRLRPGFLCLKLRGNALRPAVSVR
jgi:hypothetical protein